MYICIYIYIHVNLYLYRALSLFLENTVLYGRSGIDADSCRDAFLSLPLAQRRLFAHAYFSRLWNIAASERLRRYVPYRAVKVSCAIYLFIYPIYIHIPTHIYRGLG